MNDLILRYSHNVIEHLGFKLYQNKPTNVIAELVSNAWDTDATQVWIQIDMASGGNRFIVVSDNGIGMDTETLINVYLIIGKPKRQINQLGKTTPKYRKLMGRKGIGKLAPFGIARQLDILTVYKSNGVRKITWFRLNLNEILKHNGGSELTSTYKPLVFLNHADIPAFDPMHDTTGTMAHFLNRIGEGTGTINVLTELSLTKTIPLQSLKESMGRRFTVTLMRNDFQVYINQHQLTEKEALPNFEFRIPTESPFEGDYINGKEIKFWVGFASQALPVEQRGIGVYAHGKIVQDRPFTFGVTAEIDTQSMYGVVEADWLDELPQDMVSTDRTSIDWTVAETDALYQWGEKKIRTCLNNYQLWRSGREEIENATRIEAKIKNNELPKIMPSERQMIAKLLSDVTPRLGKDEQTKGQITKTVTQAWLHRPMRKLIKNLWDKLKQDESMSSSQVFLNILTQLEEHSVPESLSLAVTFAQRAYALSLLYDLVHKGKEPHLQQLIETFPWILHPDMAILTANKTLKSVVEQAAKEGLLPSNQIKAQATERPDFVYFSNSEATKLVVVEIKSPRNELTIDNREQLHQYLTYFETRYSQATIEGELIGNNPNKIQTVRNNMKIRTWEEVFLNSRHGHLELLAAMLSEAQPETEDARMKDVAKFGGEEIWALLNKMAQHHDELASLFQKFQSSTGQLNCNFDKINEL